MFTGIVAAVGRIESVAPQGTRDGGVRLVVDARQLSLDGVALGDSIAVNGACMTVVEVGGGRFAIDVSRESLARTCGLDAPGDVNLEKSLRLGDALGGHLVFGHVDGVGSVTALTPLGESCELVVRAPAPLRHLLAYKGSVTVNGVSLTVNRVEDRAGECEFSINLIPHTLSMTTLHQLRAGARVNLEADMIARYVARMLEGRILPRDSA